MKSVSLLCTLFLTLFSFQIFANTLIDSVKGKGVDIPDNIRERVQKYRLDRPEIDAVDIVSFDHKLIHQRSDSLRVKVPSKVSVKFALSNYTVNDAGDLMWSGVSKNDKASMRVYFDGQKPHGFIYTPRYEFEIIGIDHKSAFLVRVPNDMKPASIHPQHQNVFVPKLQANANSLDALFGLQSTPEDIWGWPAPPEVRIMFMYTASARDLVGGQGVVEQRVNNSMDEIKEALINSGLGSHGDDNLKPTHKPADVVFQNVRVRFMPYSEANRTHDQHLDAMRFGNNGLENLASFRTADSADVSVLIVRDTDNNQFCATAATTGATSVNLANIVIDINCLNQYNLAHEIGHLFGLQHEAGQVTPGSNPGPYAYGFVNYPEGFGTVMSITCMQDPNCVRVGHYSYNGTISKYKYQGKTTGSATADASRVMSDNALSIASLVPPSRTPVSGLPAPSMNVSPEFCYGLNAANWSTVNGADNYKLYRGPNSSMTTSVFVKQTTSNFDLVNINASDSYKYFAVKACTNAGVCSGFSNAGEAQYYSQCF